MPKQETQLTVDTTKLQTIFARYPEIQAVYLFGSTAADTNRPDSDLDLAMVPRSKVLRRQKLDILADLAQAGFDNVDLVILDTKDLVLQAENHQWLGWKSFASD